MRADQIHDGPLDGTRLAADIARDFPGLNESIRRAEWRADLKRRVRDRRDVEEAGAAPCCCHRGATRGDEYPEAPCDRCPVHNDPTSDHRCRRHRAEERSDG